MLSGTLWGTRCQEMNCLLGGEAPRPFCSCCSLWPDSRARITQNQIEKGPTPGPLCGAPATSPPLVKNGPGDSRWGLMEKKGEEEQGCACSPELAPSSPSAHCPSVSPLSTMAGNPRMKALLLSFQGQAAASQPSFGIFGRRRGIPNASLRLTHLPTDPRAAHGSRISGRAKTSGSEPGVGTQEPGLRVQTQGGRRGEGWGREEGLPGPLKPASACIPEPAPWGGGTE